MPLQRVNTGLGMMVETPLVSTQDSEPTLSILPASDSDLGAVKVDGVTIVISEDGTISAPGGGGGGAVLQHTVSISAAQIRNLFAAPVVLAPGVPAKRIVPVSISVAYAFGTTVYNFNEGSDAVDYAVTGDPTAAPSGILVQALQAAMASNFSDWPPNSSVINQHDNQGNDLILAASGGSMDTGSILTAAVGAGGAGYAPLDPIFIPNVSGAEAQASILTVDGSGAVLTFAITDNGTGYAVANNVPTTGGSGDGNFTIDITAISPLGDGSVIMTTSYLLV